MTFEEWLEPVHRMRSCNNEHYTDEDLKSAFEAGKGDIADLKANFDYVLEGKDLEIKLLGERCNQLLKDKGNLTDELQELKETLAQTIENDEVAYETLKLHNQEEIGMLNSKVTKLEQQIEKMKCCALCNNYDMNYLPYWCRTNCVPMHPYEKCKLWEIKEND